MKTFVAVLAVLGLAAMTQALIIPTIVGGASAAGLSIPLIGGASATAGPALATLTALAGGALTLKAVGALAAAVAGQAGTRVAVPVPSVAVRGKRSAIEETESEKVFSFIAQSEPQACYRRLICDLATGAMPASDNDVILASFNEEVPATSHKFEYAIAAQVGKALKSVESCEVRYSCPLTGPQITKLFH